MSYQQQPGEENLAYGDEYSSSRGQGNQQSGQTGERSLLGSTISKLKNRYDQHQESTAQKYGYSSSGSNQGNYGQQAPNTGYTQSGQQGSSTGYGQSGQYGYQGQAGAATQNPQQKQDFAGGVFGALHETIQSIGSDVGRILGTDYRPPGQQQYGQQPYGQQQGAQQQYGQQQYGQQQGAQQQYGQQQYGQQQGAQQQSAQQQYGHQQGAQQQYGQQLGSSSTGHSLPPSSGYFNQGQATTGYSGPSAGYSNQGSNAAANQPQKHRFDSFASVKNGNDVKWYVDGCSYFWAISRALDEAKESVWILDWWLSPEIYLRRPPAQNEQWRLDRVLQRVANRGVKVNVIVYKEVTQALTLSSSHTKHALEDLSPNIAVFRHPDHLPDSQTTQSSLLSAFQGLKLNAASISKVGQDTLKGIFGITNDVILYWAHHEKLCLIDGRHAFMGGLDLCFGRWDTNQHSIADAHPENQNLITFPGQDYNNARVMDFSDVAHPDQNKVDRTRISRMGWTDISVSLHGPCVDDLRHHFIDRWNFIYAEKYNVRKDVRYSPLRDPFTHDSTMQVPVPQHLTGGAAQTSDGQPQQYQQGQPPQQYQQQQSTPGTQQQYAQTFAPPPGSQPYTQPAWQTSSKPHSQQHYPPPPPGPPPPGGRPHGPPPQGQPPPNFAPGYNQPASQVQTDSYAQQQPQSTPQAGQPTYQADQSTYQTGQSTFPTGQSPYQAEQSTYQTGQSTYPTGQSPYQAEQSTSQAGQSAPSASQQQTSQSQYTAYQGSTELPATQTSQQAYQQETYQSTPGTRGLDDGDSTDRGLGSRFKGEGKQFGQELSSFGNMIAGSLQQKTGKYLGKLGGTNPSPSYGPMQCQILRSCTLWSNGTPTERSIQTAYIDVIEKSQHFVYIENQFFITATGEQQKPVQNLVGKALVDRILRAARNNEKYKVIVVIPAVPGFAGDLRSDDSLGTRAIMEFQYFSINRGGHSIMELIAQAGYNPLDYIRFYNLRNYDRINTAPGSSGASGNQYQQYQPTGQQSGQTAPGRWDSVAECYMLGGQDIRNVPWNGEPEAELDAFVSEELYIHSKTLIADDRVVICGSANLNDRSQLGTHDSEIAILIDDPTPVQTTMNGQPWQASRFAASLRRQIFRKHLGLLRPQDMTRPDANFEPVGIANSYDWGSPEDHIVADPLADTFQALWNTRARTNTNVFRRAFRAVPDDNVQNWHDYKEFFEFYFNTAVSEADDKKPPPGGKPPPGTRPPLVPYGHVVRQDFPGGVRELKELLSTVKGTLVEMPLTFLGDEDIAKEGLSLNPFTVQIYT